MKEPEVTCKFSRLSQDQSHIMPDREDTELAIDLQISECICGVDARRLESGQSETIKCHEPYAGGKFRCVLHNEQNCCLRHYRNLGNQPPILQRTMLLFTAGSFFRSTCTTTDFNWLNMSSVS